MLQPAEAWAEAKAHRILVLPVATRGAGHTKVVTAFPQVFKRTVVSTRSSGGEAMGELSVAFIPKEWRRRISKCGTDISCLARYAIQLRASEVVYTTARARASGVRFKVRMVDATQARITRTTSVDASSVAGLQAALAAKLQVLVAKSRPRSPQAIAAGRDPSPPIDDPLNPDALLSLEPLPPASKHSSPPTPAVRRSNSAAAGQHAMPPRAAPHTPNLEHEMSAVPEAETRSATQLPAGTDPRSQLLHPFSTPAPAPSRSPALLITGIGLGALGTLSFATGVYYGDQAASLEVVAPGTDQIAVHEQKSDQNRKASLANRLMLFGGTGALLGLGAIVLHMVGISYEAPPGVAAWVDGSGAAAITYGQSF